MREPLMKEGVDYTLVPVDDANEQAWNIRVDTGPFVESVLSFGNIAFDGERDVLTFNFEVVYSPISDLTPADPELQEFTSKLLSAVIDKAIQEKELILSDGDKPIEY